MPEKQESFFWHKVRSESDFVFPKAEDQPCASPNTSREMYIINLTIGYKGAQPSWIR